MYQRKRQQGISLLELMISLAIGLILLMALASLMIAANNSAKQRSTSELMDEQARQVFFRLENDLYRSGFVDSFMNDATLQTAFDTNNQLVAASYTRQISNITDADRVSLLGRNTNGIILPLQGFDDQNAPPTVANMTCTDTRQCLQIAYQAVGSNLAAGNFSSVSTEAQENSSLSGATIGCNGLRVDNAFPILRNAYQLGVANNENNASLQCRSERMNFAGASDGTGDGFQPVVVGVEQLVFRYLTTPADGTAADSTPNLGTTLSGRSVNQYLRANAVQALPLRWSAVVGVEICVVVAAEPLDGGREGDIPTVQPNVPSCLRDDDNDTTANAAWAADVARTQGDMRLHRRYVRTILMPNSLHLVN